MRANLDYIIIHGISGSILRDQTYYGPTVVIGNNILLILPSLGSL